MLVKEIFRLHKIFFLNQSVFCCTDNTTLDPNQYPTIFPRIPDTATAVDKIKTLTKPIYKSTFSINFYYKFLLKKALSPGKRNLQTNLFLQNDK
jgi:hypothetical protein